MRSTRRRVGWPAVVISAIVVAVGGGAPTHASLAGLHQQIARAADGGSSVPGPSPSTTLLHGLQAQVSSVTRSLDSFLNQHTDDAKLQQADHQQIASLLDTLQRLSTAQQEIDARHQAQIEQDHSNLLQLIESQKRQQALLTEELQHSKSLESQLAELKQSQEMNANQHAAAHELEQSMHLEHDFAQQQQQMANGGFGSDEIEGSFLETSARRLHAIPQLHAVGHEEHDIDMAHTMDHAQESDLEMSEQELLEAQSEQTLGAEAAAGAASIDPSRYGSSADYLAAMDTADQAEMMSPQQLQQLSSHLNGASHQVGTPQPPRAGLHSMSEIDSLVAEGAEENHPKEFEFHAEKLHNPALQQQLSELQDEDSIQQAMLHAQAKIRAIAAELQRHQAANGPDHSAGIEIDMFDVASDEPHF